MNFVASNVDSCSFSVILQFNLKIRLKFEINSFTPIHNNKPRKVWTIFHKRHFHHKNRYA